MSARLQLDDLRQAWQARDPVLIRQIHQLMEQPVSEPEEPIREGALTWDKYLREIRGDDFKRKSPEEQMQYRLERTKELEAPDAEVPLPDKLRTHEILFLLWEDNGLFARQCLLEIISNLPLQYGPWRALKRIFKEAEARNDTEIYGALAARFDMEFSNYYSEIGRATLAYLVRRAWRYLRRIGRQLPPCYPDTACDFLSRYTDETNWSRTWIANHIYYHETGRYGRASFQFGWRVPDNVLKDRAYADLWRRTPRPLFSLMERARAEHVRKFATEALKTDFRATLREVEPEWVARLVNVNSETVDDFVVWILKNVPRFEQSAFHDLGLHEAVLKLFDSQSSTAGAYAAEYARSYARDLPVAELIRLMGNRHDAVRKLAEDLLRARDPRKEIGLEAWGELLEIDSGHKLAAEMIRKHFGAAELTPAWFRQRLLSENDATFKFAKDLLPQVHDREQLGPTFYQELFESLERMDEEQLGYQVLNRVPRLVMQELKRFEANDLDPDFLQRLLLHPATGSTVQAWINEGRLKAKTLPVNFYKSLAFHPDWEGSPWIENLRANYRWAKDLRFDDSPSIQVLEWLKDVRKFTTSDLGFEWLLKLVMRSEPLYHDFAVETLTKSFVPADFAPQEKGAKDEPATVELAGQRFLFTGKLSSMTRDEAHQKVKEANGTVFKSVSNKLHYLVIGDDGSPLFGQGKKGSKQVKAEELNEKGGNIRIISETAFLQMLTEGKRDFSEDQVRAGCERLWEMAVAPGKDDAPLGSFARKYIELHHPDLGKERTDLPVDPNAAIPRDFFTWERIKPLLNESRKPLRDLALSLARWELARWSPPVEDLLRLSESTYPEVRKMIADALLAEDTPESSPFRLDPETLSPDAIYAFCESPDEASRALGMELIRRSPRLQVPEELFRLTESPDRRVRAFVIRTLWHLYRDRGISADWKPTLPPQSAVSSAERKATEKKLEALGEGAPAKPEQPPAPLDDLESFLRRILFEIPPGRMESRKGERDGILQRVKPMSSSKAKLSLIETMRDMATEEQPLAEGLLPLLEEFMQSRGKMEHDACLVAITRLKGEHGFETV